ncbi:MAG: RNA polymerase sigma factor [Deltaproteobacteria bacterium]|nr:RNA polymerase sigma factor [Deltaproteobacteria bacterium]
MNAKVVELVPLSTGPSDEELIRRCASGNTPALAALFERHHLATQRFLSRLVGWRSSELEDLLQSTFLLAYTSARSFRGQASVRSWIFGIGANLVRRQRRTGARRDAALRLMAAPAPESPMGPDDVVARKQLVERLSAAVLELPHDLRVAYVLCELEDVSGPEAATALGIRPGTLWRRLFDARKRLVRALEGGAE